MLKVTRPQFGDLTKNEQNNVSDNGSGKEYAGYIKVSHNGATILLENDAMEREDAVFCRDLSWISGIIEKVYELGKTDASLSV